jgi:hypothetical protein
MNGENKTLDQHMQELSETLTELSKYNGGLEVFAEFSRIQMQEMDKVDLDIQKAKEYNAETERELKEFTKRSHTEWYITLNDSGEFNRNEITIH